MKISDSIIKGIGRGNEKAYAELFDVCYASLHELAYAYVLDYTAADDIVQEVLISLFERTDVSNISNLSSYLRTSVRNRSLNFLRDLSLEFHNREMYVWEFSQREGLDEEEMNSICDMLRHEVDNLPKACREICQLRFYEGLKIREIAQRLNISEGTVKAQLHRALQSIKGAMREDGFTHLSLTNCIVFLIFFHIL